MLFGDCSLELLWCLELGIWSFRKAVVVSAFRATVKRLAVYSVRSASTGFR
jgi:hypothetical protein